MAKNKTQYTYTKRTEIIFQFQSDGSKFEDDLPSLKFKTLFFASYNLNNKYVYLVAPIRIGGFNHHHRRSRRIMALLKRFITKLTPRLMSRIESCTLLCTYYLQKCTGLHFTWCIIFLYTSG